MSSLLKNIIASPLLGLAAFMANQYLITSTVTWPTNSQDIISLGIVIAAIFVGGLIVSAGSHGYEDYYDDSEREEGVIKWFNHKKGYGFITRDQGDDVFVHYRNIEGGRDSGIKDGQRVSFIVAHGDKGLQAEEVEPE